MAQKDLFGDYFNAAFNTSCGTARTFILGNPLQTSYLPAGKVSSVTTPFAVPQFKSFLKNTKSGIMIY